jgi:hypothetical protein
LGSRRIRFTDAERRRLACKAHLVGRKVLCGFDTLVTPDTLLRGIAIWARESGTTVRGADRPRTLQTIDTRWGEERSPTPCGSRVLIPHLPAANARRCRLSKGAP